MPQGSSPKRERQYEHIKQSAKKRGESTGRAEEIAARTVNKERARSGEAKTASRSSTQDISSARRGGQRSHRGRRRPDQGPALRGGTAPWREGPFVDEQGATGPRGRPLTQAALTGQRKGREPGPIRGMCAKAKAAGAAKRTGSPSSSQKAQLPPVPAAS